MSKKYRGVGVIRWLAKDGEDGKPGKDARVIKLHADTLTIKKLKDGSIIPNTYFLVWVTTQNVDDFKYTFRVDGLLSQPPSGVLVTQDEEIMILPSLVDFNTLTIIATGTGDHADISDSITINYIEEAKDIDPKKIPIPYIAGEFDIKRIYKRALLSYPIVIYDGEYFALMKDCPPLGVTPYDDWASNDENAHWQYIPYFEVLIAEAIFAGIIQLTNSNKITTAGLSGDNSNDFLPAFWSGGTYQEANNFGVVYKAIQDGLTIPNKKMANVVHLHNGVSKIGDLMFHPDGSAFFLNKNGVVSYRQNAQNIPTLYDLTNNNQIPITTVNEAHLNKQEEFVLPESINIEKQGATLRFQGTFTTNWTNATEIDKYSECYLYFNGYPYMPIAQHSDYNIYVPQVSEIDKTFHNLPAGKYTVGISPYSHSSSPYIARNKVSMSKSYLSSTYNPFAHDLVHIGGDGVAMKFGSNIFHVSENGIVGRGNIDFETAAMLVSGSVGSNGQKESGGNFYSDLVDTGVYIITHDFGTLDYNIRVMLSDSALTAYSSNKESNSIKVNIINASNNEPVNQGFSFVITTN